MTSDRFNSKRAEAIAEQAIYDALPKPLREAIASAPQSLKPSVVRDALLRGVDESTIIETINRRKS